MSWKEKSWHAWNYFCVTMAIIGMWTSFNVFRVNVLGQRVSSLTLPGFETSAENSPRKYAQR